MKPASAPSEFLQCYFHFLDIVIRHRDTRDTIKLRHPSPQIFIQNINNKLKAF